MHREVGEMGWGHRSWRLFPFAIAVSATVVALPAAFAWALSSREGVPAWLAALLALAISSTLSWLLRESWLRGPYRRDLLFSELLLWGWLAAVYRERQFTRACKALSSLHASAATGRRARLPRPARWQTIRQLAAAVDGQDVYLRGHSRRVSHHATAIARRMGLSPTQLARIRAAAAVHDVGKLRVPRELVDKPQRLADDELVRIRRHATEGARIVAVLGDPELTAIVRHQHERFDGRGYPSGLTGKEIPLGARILAVADTFDAITSVRPYRSAASQRQAVATLRRCSGTQLDPEVVHAFLSSYARRRPVLVLASVLVAPERALARSAGAAPRGRRTMAVNAAAILAATAALAAGGASARQAAPAALTASVHLTAHTAVTLARPGAKPVRVLHPLHITGGSLGSFWQAISAEVASGSLRRPHHRSRRHKRHARRAHRHRSHRKLPALRSRRRRPHPSAGSPYRPRRLRRPAAASPIGPPPIGAPPGQAPAPGAGHAGSGAGAGSGGTAAQPSLSSSASPS